MKEVPKSQVIASKKKELYKKSDQYKSAVVSDLKGFKFDLKQLGKNVLFIGGTLYVTYKLTKLFLGSSTQEADEPNQPEVKSLAKLNQSSPVADKIKEQIALFLLVLAFNKLKEYLKEITPKNDEQADSKDA